MAGYSDGEIQRCSAGYSFSSFFSAMRVALLTLLTNSCFPLMTIYLTQETTFLEVLLKVPLAIPLQWLAVLAPQVYLYALTCHWAHISGWLESEFSYGTPPAVCFRSSLLQLLHICSQCNSYHKLHIPWILNVSVFLKEPYMDAKILPKSVHIFLCSLTFLFLSSTQTFHFPILESQGAGGLL